MPGTRKLSRPFWHAAAHGPFPGTTALRCTRDDRDGDTSSPARSPPWGHTGREDLARPPATGYERTRGFWGGLCGNPARGGDLSLVPIASRSYFRHEPWQPAWRGA